ncbi:MAG: TIGR03067 domain-containing protein [Planctomycetota bacterium]
MGLAGSAAIAIDKTVFIAGTPGDSIGTGERLQILTDDGWQAINGEDGKPVWGSEVVTSMGFMALKVRNAAGKTVIGYATYGERISAPSKTPPSSTANRTPPKMTRPSGPIAPVPVDDDPVFNTRDEAAYAELKAYVEVNEEVRTALEQAFGKEGARKKMVEMAINAMRSSGKENLIDDYKRLSPLVPDSEKPKSNGDEEPAFKNINVDPNQVASMLNGDWKAMRFVAEGNDLPDSAVDTLQMAFRDGKYVMQMGPNLETGTYNFDATRYPFGLTIKISTGKNKGQIRRGAFKFLEGNRLMFVMGTNGKDEPTQFLSTKSNKCIMAVYSKQ